MHKVCVDANIIVVFVYCNWNQKYNINKIP